MKTTKLHSNEATFQNRYSESDSSKSYEPKESWEYYQRQWRQCSSSNNIITSSLHQWTEESHNIAQIVFKISLSDNESLLSMVIDNNNNNDNNSVLPDLLRVFAYNTISENETFEKGIGSSPHTDWGTSTVDSKVH